MGEWVELGDGIRAWRSRPHSGAGPGVLLLHPWWGLNATMRDFADRLSGAGFVVVAPDLYRGAVVDTIEAAEVAVDREPASARRPIVRAGLDHLRVQPGVEPTQMAVVGFSMGAWFALDAANSDPGIAAVVLNYGTGPTSDRRSSNPAVQGHFAADDPYEAAEYVDGLEASLRAGGLDVQFHRYRGVHHWFMEPDRPEYDVAAATLGWDRTIAFLHDLLTPR